MAQNKNQANITKAAFEQIFFLIAGDDTLGNGSGNAGALRRETVPGSILHSHSDRDNHRLNHASLFSPSDFSGLSSSS
jgi:hypothetical protein